MQPAVACYLCYCQLRKCHNLRARSLRADMELTQLIRRGEVENKEIIKMKSREILRLSGLCVTPIELIAAEVPGHSPNTTSLSSRCKEETETDSRPYTDLLKVEEWEDDEIDREVQRDGESIENNSSVDGEEINDQSEDAVNIQTDEYSDRCTDPGDIKQEKPEEAVPYVRRCIGYLKFEDSEDYENIVIWRDVPNIENERVTVGKETQRVTQQSVEAVNAENMEVAERTIYNSKNCFSTAAEIEELEEHIL